jgi:uncharacterized lipoprotein YajG
MEGEFMEAAHRAVICVAMLLISACSTNSVNLSYKPPATVIPKAQDAPTITVGSFVDQRGETATWFGAIRGGYGNPLKKLEATPSVSAVVQTAFKDGLQSRGLLSNTGDGTYQLSGMIKKFDCSQYVRREAHAEIEVHIFDKAGKQVFSQTYTADELEGSLLALNVGVFASVETLRALAEKSLSEVVDKSLDNSALRNSMR